MKQWLVKRAEKDRQLYEQYRKPLEAEHHGEYVAIGPDGSTLLSTSDIDVVVEVIQTFGRGNFALARVGHRSFGQWLSAID